MECSLKRLCSLWVLLSLHLTSCGAFLELKSTTPGCKSINSTLSCDLHNITEEAGFRNDNWKGEGIKQFLITGATTIFLIAQKGIADLKWNFTSCSDVRIDQSVGSEIFYLGFTDSTVSVLTPHNVSVLKSEGSTLKKVDIDTNQQFDFVNSLIEDLSINVTGKRSTIIDSNVTRISNMVLDGNFRFLIDSSQIGKVDKLEIKLTDTKSEISDSRFRSVGVEGLLLHGVVFNILRTEFDYLASKAIVVNTSLTIKDCKIGRFQLDSFKVLRGSIHFENVAIGDKNVSFAIKNVSGEYFPLASLFPEHAQSKVSLALGLGIPVSMVAGILCGVALAYFILQRRHSGQSQDNFKLLPETKVEAHRLPSQPPPPTPIVQHEPVSEGKDDDDEIYEEYQDVNVDGPSPPLSINLLPVSNNIGNGLPPKLPPQPSPGGQQTLPPQRRDGLPPKGGLPTPPHAPPSLPGPPPAPPGGQKAPPPPQRRDGLPSKDGLPTPLPPLAATLKPSIKPLPPKATPATPPKFGNKPDSTPADSSPDANDLELYDEVNDLTPVTTVPPSSVRPQILSKKPSFLHNASNPKPALPPPDSGKSKGPPTPTKPKPSLPDGKFKLPQWPPPPSGDTKPSPGTNSLEEDENDIYEEIPE